MYRGRHTVDIQIIEDGEAVVGAGATKTLDFSIGLLIRNKRRELGLSQDDIARRLGIPQGSVSKLERGLGGEQHTQRILDVLMLNPPR